MKEKFESFQKEFKSLKKQFKQNKITEPEFKTRLKRLQLKDNDGRYWTIGAQTGQWYHFDGKQWVQDQPPSLQDRKAICIYCGAENDLETEVCVKCKGNILSEKAKSPIQISPDYSGNTDDWEIDTDEIPEEEQVEYCEIRSIGAFSLLRYLGGVGLFIGMVLGVFAGATDYLPGLQLLTPVFIRDLHGSLAGGVIYSLYGGISGFALLGITGFLFGLLSNFIFSLFGGIKIKLSS